MKTKSSNCEIVYLTWGETPRSYGVYGTQVVNQLRETKKHCPDFRFRLIAGLPLFHSGLVREKRRYSEELKSVQNRLSDIGLSITPIFAPQTFINSRRFEFRLFHGLANNVLARQLKALNPLILHCRSYHAAYAALQAKQKSELSFKVVFDARGLWPEESVFKGRFSETGPDYRFAKTIESKILYGCEVTVAVSDAMKRHYQELGAQNCQTIYLSASVNDFSKNLDIGSMPQNDGSQIFTTLCYVGALSEDAWHTPTNLFALYKVFRKFTTHPRLLIVTTSDHSKILDACRGIPVQEIQIKSSKSNSELASILQTAHFGALPFMLPISKAQRAIAHTMLATKTAEYLAAGLPILFNKYCGGISSIVERHNIGLSYDPAEPERVINSVALDQLMTLETRKLARKVAVQLFDSGLNATKYAQLYRDLIKENLR